MMHGLKTIITMQWLYLEKNNRGHGWVGGVACYSRNNLIIYKRLNVIQGHDLGVI